MHNSCSTADRATERTHRRKARCLLPPFVRGHLKPLLPLPGQRPDKAVDLGETSGLSLTIGKPPASLARFPSALQRALRTPAIRKRRDTVPAGGGGTPVVVSAGLLHEVSFAANDP